MFHIFVQDLTDLLTFAFAFVMLAGVAALAGYVQAYRATTAHPAEVLREE